jgi:hypothetical protein
MGGTSTQQQQSTQQSQLTPWAPAAGALNGLINNVTPLANNLNGGPDVQSALGKLSAVGQGANPLADPSMNAAASQLGGAQNYGQATGILSDAYGKTQSALSPYTTGNPYDLQSNPALAQALGTVNTDVMNSVNPMFAAAGRLASPSNYQALGRGITQGSTGILQNAATNQLNAINSLQGAAGNTAGGLLGADAANAGIQSQGIGNAATAYGTQTLGPQLQLQSALMGNQLPIQNAQSLAGILGPLAGMFGQQTGSGTQSGSQTLSPAAQAWGWINSLSGAYKNLGFGGGK